MIIPEIKARLKELGWAISGNKDVLIERLGWAEQLQSCDIFLDKPAVVQNSVWFQDLIKTGPIVKRLPKASRLQAAKAFTETFKSVTEEPSQDSWENFVKFPRSVFQKPKRAGSKKINLASSINKRIESFKNGSLRCTRPPPTTKKVDPQTSLKKAVAAKIQMFDVKGAIRIASSNDVVADHSQQVKDRLRSKHPASNYSAKDFPDPNKISVDNISCTKEEVRRGIHSFRNGSGAGIMGLYPQILKDLTSKEMGVTGENLLEAITVFLNQVVFAGKIPDEALSTFYGASLMGLEKVDGGIRPIAIGLTLRRLAGKIIMMKLHPKCEELFQPIQLGVCTKNGCEIAVHGLRKWLESPNDLERVLLKIDFSNAFNSIRRDVALKLVNQHTPQIYKFIHQAYANHSNLFFGEDDIILSQQGVQQGDPCGPFLFALTILNLTNQMKSEGNIWYLDDSTLCGDAKSVIRDFENIKKASTTLGLDINMKKCELVIVDQQSEENTALLNNFCKENPAITRVGQEELTLLGAPVMPESIEAVLTSKLESLKLMSRRLELLDSHDAMYLLKNCFSLPKLNYFLRASPCFLKEDLLKEYDEVIRESLVSILNIKLDGTSNIQYSLPVCLGGLGIRASVDISIPAFLSSSHGTIAGVNALFPKLNHLQDNIFFNSAKNIWLSRLGPTAELPGNQSIQASWDLPYCQKKYDDLLSSAQSKAVKARLKAVASPHSSDWLNAVPVASLGLKLSDSNIRVACGLRLGSPLCHTHLCHCGKRVDESGTHGLSCQKSIGRLARHDHVNKLIKQALGSAEITSRLEPKGTSIQDRKRPDGISYFPFKNGRHGISPVQTLWLALISKSLLHQKLVKQHLGLRTEN
jgi:hypothetical protein